MNFHRFILPLLTLCVLAVAGAASAQTPAENPLWLRHPAVSPDGTAIAFTAGGRIWRVPVAGGVAVPLTDADQYSTRPVWSPDGSMLAFAAKPHGNFDLFIMPAGGGKITRLTYHSADDQPCAFSPDGSVVYFASSRLGSPETILAGGYANSDQLYAVPALGGRSRLVIPTPALAVSADPRGGQLLYEDRPVYENEWRKGAVSDGAHDIWLYDLAKKTHRKLTDFRGEDRNPVWAPDGSGYYYLSERSGSFNVWRAGLKPGARPVQVTAHRETAVRFLSVANNGTLVYGLEGEIWCRPAGAKQAARVPVRLPPGADRPATTTVSANDYLTEMKLSADGTQVAVVARGEVFVLSTATGTTRRITRTAAHERDVSFAPDGRSLVYVSERDGDMNIYEATLDEGTGIVVERKLVDTAGDVLYPKISPDGRLLAYLADRNQLRVLNRATGATVTALPAGYFYSYRDDDMSFEWSPDSRWLTATVGSIVTNQDIVLLDASGRAAPMTVTHSGYHDAGPRFSPDGKAVLWASGREGMRHADATTGQLDIYLAYLTRAGFDAKDEADGADWQPQPGGIEQRTKRLTPFSLTPLLYALSAGHDSLLVVEKSPAGKAVARRFDVATGESTELFTRPLADAYAVDAAGSQVYALAGGAVERTDLATGTTTSFPLDTTMDVDVHAEAAHWFNHFWRLTKLKFYEPTLHGRDWDALRTRYARFLPHLETWEDFAEMMSELAGELNASHMGCYYLKPPPLADHTASLGVHFDDDYAGPGLRVAAVLPGGPADLPGSRLGPGTLILAIDSELINEFTNLDQLLNGMADTAVQLLIQPPGSKTTLIETVVPMTGQQAVALSYARWVAGRKALVEKLSGGRLGYVHLPAMDLDTYKRAYGEVIGDYRNKEALVIDVRYNAGGNLHEQLVTLFTGELLAGFTNRDNEVVGRIPSGRWARPTALVQNAASYSDGSIFPHLYQRQKLGPVVGDRTPGTGTAVWWMLPMKGALKWGIPQLGARDFKTGWFENREIVPDVAVANDPGSLAAGRDPQLEAAVGVLLKKLPRR
ncbi:MAG TPA: S41 family peptidase [Lacunisphaera sp.]